MFYLRKFCGLILKMSQLFGVVVYTYITHLFDITATFSMDLIAQNCKYQSQTNSGSSSKFSIIISQTPASKQITYNQVIYCNQRKKKNDEITLKCRFSLPQIVLLNLLGYFQQIIPNIYKEQDPQKYYGMFQTKKTQKLAQLINNDHLKVENCSAFKKKHKNCELAPGNIVLPEFVWLDSTDEDLQLIVDHLIGYEMNFFRLQNNILVQKSFTKVQQFDILIENLRKGNYAKGQKGKAKSINEFKCKYISRYLLIQLKQNEIDLLNKFCIIETQTKFKNLYKYYNNMTIQIILEFCDVFKMITARKYLMSKQIFTCLISKSFLQQSRPKFTHVTQDHFNPKFNISKVVCQLQDSDILLCQRYMNTTQNEFFHNVRFMLENEQAFFPHHQKQFELLHGIIKSYSSHTVSKQLEIGELDSFQKFDKKYTAAALQHGKLLLHKLQKIVQETEMRSELTKQISKRKNNNLLGKFVENIKSMAENKQMIIVEGGEEIPVPKKIANYHEYQGWSTRVARWDKLYQTIAIHHSHSQTFFKSTTESLEEKDSYDVEENDQKDEYQKGELKEMQNEEEGKEEDYKEGDQQKKNVSPNKKDFKKKKIQQLQSRKQFMEKVQQQRFPDLSCLGCTTFFYYNMNIRNIEICSTPYHLAGQSSKIEQNKVKISQAMLDLMNCLGGVILFDCVAEGRQVLPRGQEHTYIIQDKIKEELQKIYQEIKYDSSKIKTEMLITFVPIYKNPYKHKPSKNGERKRKWNFFVTRVKINRMLNQQCQKEIKYENEQEERQKNFMRHKITCFHEGNCEISLQSIIKEKVDKDKEKKDKAEKIKHLPLQKRYKFASLMIINCDAKSFQSELNNQLFQCKISIKYRQFGLAKIQNTAILFHNSQLEKIQQYCKNKKQVFIKEIKQFLYLPDWNKEKPLTKDDLNHIVYYTPQCTKEFQNEPIILWRYQDKPNSYGKDTEFYFQLQSKEKAALMYLIIRQCGQRVKFKYPNERQKDHNGRYKFEFKQKDLQKYRLECAANYKPDHLKEKQEIYSAQIEEKLKMKLYQFFQEVAKTKQQNK